MTIAADFAKGRLDLISPPAPGVTKPNGRQQVERRRFRSAILRVQANQDFVRVRFGIFDLDLEETALGQRARVPNFELTFKLRASSILRDQLLVRKSRLRIAINHPHETMRRRA